MWYNGGVAKHNNIAKKAQYIEEFDGDIHAVGEKE